MVHHNFLEKLSHQEELLGMGWGVVWGWWGKVMVHLEISKMNFTYKVYLF